MRSLRYLGITANACAFILLHACQTVPTSQEFDAGVVTTHILLLEPHQAAVCMARNVDRHEGKYMATIRGGVAPVLVEIDIRNSERIALARLLIHGNGTKALIWTTRAPSDRRKELVSRMISGC